MEKYVKIKLENWQLIVSAFNSFSFPLAQAKEAAKLLDAIKSAEEIKENNIKDKQTKEKV